LIYELDIKEMDKHLKARMDDQMTAYDGKGKMNKYVFSQNSFGVTSIPTQISANSFQNIKQDEDDFNEKFFSHINDGKSKSQPTINERLGL